MKHTQGDILEVLDRASEDFTFPMLDNGYVYPVESRLTLFRSEEDWAITLELAAFAPRGGLPDTCIATFASRLANRVSAEDYVSPEAHQRYLENNPHNESRYIHPIDAGPWQDEECWEWVAENANEVVLRGVPVPVPPASRYEELGIELIEGPRVCVFELCRALAPEHREALLATDEELRVNVLPEMSEVLRLDDWHHPDLAEGERPSSTETFRQLAEVLLTGDAKHYAPTEAPNTHWSNWPDGGTL